VFRALCKWHLRMSQTEAVFLPSLSKHEERALGSEASR